MNSKKRTFPIKRFSLLFFPLFSLFFIVFWILIESESAHEIKFRAVEQRHKVLLAKEIIEHRFEEIRNDIFTQSNHHELTLFFRRDREKELRIFSGELSRFLEINGNYGQARLLDMDGNERLRINIVNGKSYIVPEKDLQFKGDKYYFQEAKKLDKGRIYISRFDLNMEKGAVEIPYNPTIRFAKPVFDEDNKKRGVFVLNYKGRIMLEHIDALFNDNLSFPLLLNKEGYFLKGFKADYEWGFMFNDGEAKTFETFYRDEWKEIANNESGTYSGGDGLFTYETIRFSVENYNWKIHLPAPPNLNNFIEWKIISLLPKENLDFSKTSVFIRHSSVLIILTPVLFILSWMLAVTAEKKRREEEKQLESKKMLQTILDTLPEHVFWKDNDLNYLGCNRSFADDAGIETPGQVKGKSDLNMPWKNKAEEYRKEDLEVIEGGRKKLNVEDLQINIDGEKRWLETSKIPLVDTKGKVYGILGTSRDITNRKKKALKNTIFKDNLIDLLQTPYISIESNYAIITKIASLSLDVERVSIWFYDEEKTAIICQDLYLRGNDTHESGIILYSKDFPGYFKALKRNRPIVAHDALTHEDTCEFSEVYLKPNGISSMLDVPVWHKGVIRGVVCCEHVGTSRIWQEEESDFLVNLAFIVAQTMDANEREELEKRRAQLISELEYANKDLSDFAYIVSHDLKAPLRGIASLANWLNTDYTDKFDEEGREHLKLLSGRVERMNSLINGILKYSRAGKSKMVMEKVDLNVVIKEIVDSISPPANIEINLKETFPVINCDWTHMVQVFQNLLSNAIKYMDKDNGIISIDYVKKDEELLFSITDNGPGIEEKYFERIFHIFQTLSPRDSVESTGVGLSLVRKIVEIYNGRVWVESTPGKGSCFYFTLPLSMKA